MYELYPYFTNDGTVGLFSRRADDIYHSTYGALTESWQKFIIPSHLEEYLATHDSVRILDICYGIGYNTKTALNLFVKKILEEKKYTEKKSKSLAKLKKNSAHAQHTIAPIHDDNISNIINEEIKKNSNENFEEKNFPGLENTASYMQSIAQIDDDNISEEECDQNDFTFDKHYTNKVESCNNILIDAVDIDKTLISLAPFIKISPRKFLWFCDKFQNDYHTQSKAIEIEKTTNSKYIKIQNELKLKREVPIIILLKLLENNYKLFEDPILQTVLTHKKYSPFLSKFMLGFIKFYQNLAYKHDKRVFNSAFLHNIYYQYITKSYKNAKNILENSKIDLNFHANDARYFMKTTSNTYNFIFLDAFTPAKCPMLWTVHFFKELYERLEEDGMILTYSNSAAVRHAFLKNGFYVGKTYDKDLKKFIGTVATKNKNLIEHELDQRDLDLINSKAGICFKDEYLQLDESTIIEDRENEIKQSELNSSTKVLKGYRNAKPI